MDNMDIKRYQSLVYRTIGAAMEVHSNLGGGLLEPIYNEALVLELVSRGIPAESEAFLPCYYKNQLMKKTYRMDVLVDDVIVELKSVKKILPAHRAQLFNYLRLTHKPVGLLINFGNDRLEGERYAYDAVTNICCMIDKNMKPIPMEETDADDWYDDPYAMVADKEQ